jgi:proteasome lid subunit RPN8/RPN11
MPSHDKLVLVTNSVQIQTGVLQTMMDHARQDSRIECCGLLAGRDGIITRAFPAENVAVNRATRYEVATKQIVHLMREIRAAGLDMLGIYHSHPNLRSEPSETDVATAGYPDAAYFIISPGADVEMPVRAFLIQEGQVAELKLSVV